MQDAFGEDTEIQEQGFVPLEITRAFVAVTPDFCFDS